MGQFNYTLPNKHLISLSGRYLRNRRSDREDTASVMLSYAIPFGVPVARKKSIGSLGGRVYDAESPRLKGIPDVIVNVNGASAVTDKKGYFLFPSLKPGTYDLVAEERNLGLDRVISLKTPIKVRIEGGEDRKVDLGVTRRASLRGKAVVFRPVDDRYVFVEGKEQNERELVESDGLSNVLIQLHKGETTIHRITDQRGYFSFEDLRPGMWFLKVYKESLPPFHYPEQATLKLELKPGAREEVVVRIVPRLRPLRLIDEGEISVEE